MTKLDSIAKESLSPLLNEADFKKRSLLWNRKRSPLVDVVQIQRGKGADEFCEHFTINVGIALPRVFHIVWGKSAPVFVQEVDCIVRARIGQLLHGDFSGNALDEWWQFATNAEKDEVRQQVRGAVQTHVIPFLDRFTTIQDLRTFLLELGGWRQRYPLTQIYLAVLHHLLGADADCRQVLRHVLETSDSAWRVRAQEVCARLDN